MEESKTNKIIKNSKWVATAASIWIQSTGGSLYTFGIYSSAIKSSQSYSQSTLDIISVFKDFGANTGLLSGLLYTSVASPPLPTSSDSARRGGSSWFSGPWVVLATGAVLNFVGYFLMWLAVVGVIFRPPVLIMCMFMLLAAHAQTFFNTADVVTAVNNFPNYSGTIVGIMKGFNGLSAAILIQVYQTIFKNRPSSYILMLALSPTLNTVVFMYFVRIINTNEVDEKRHLNRFSVVSLLIAAYLMTIIIVESYITLTLAARVIILLVLIILISTPICIAIKAQRQASISILRTPFIEENQQTNGSNQLDGERIYTRQHPSGYHQMPGGADLQPRTYDHLMPFGENLNLFQAMCTSNFWFLFLATACGIGSGLSTVNNISQIGEALGYTDFETSTLVSLWSIWNFLGRFGAGYVSDYLLHAKGWARPLFMAITLVIMSIGHSVIASGLAGSLYFGSIIVGICYGSQWSLMPTIASEIFGVVHMGTIFNTITVAGPLATYILSVRVLGYIYDKETSVEGETCFGTHCFILSFIIMALTTFLGFLAALGLFLKTRSFYKEVILVRLRLNVD